MYIETRYDRGIKDTLGQVKALASPGLGETVFCRENGRVLTFDGELWMCDDFIKAQNVSGATVVQGDTMVYVVGSSTNIAQVTKSSVSADTLVSGVCVYSALNLSSVAIAIKGIYKIKLLYFTTPTAIGGFVRTSSAGGGGNSELSTAMTSGFYAWTLQIPSTPSASIPTLVRCLIRGKVEYYF
jgi:hypothetical protein